MEQSLQTLQACSCSDGCYRCIFMYRQRFDRERTSKRRAIEQLQTILNRWQELQTSERSLSDVVINTRAESELELRFIEKLREGKGKPPGVTVTLREDFIKGNRGYLLTFSHGLGPKSSSTVVSWKVEQQVPIGAAEGVRAFSRADFLLTPTAGTIYRIDEMQADPIRLNANLGYYTNFMNLLDLAATAVPAGFHSDGLPFGVTLIAPPHQDSPLLHLASRMQQALGGKLGATAHALPPAETLRLLPGGQVRVAVVGAHLSGLPLNSQLTERNARLLATTQTAPKYRFYALSDGKRPALVRVQTGGASIACEVWEMSVSEFGSFVAGIPAPLGIGKLELADGSAVNGFICEGIGVADAKDITQYGGWRAWLAERGKQVG